MYGTSIAACGSGEGTIQTVSGLEVYAGYYDEEGGGGEIDYARGIRILPLLYNGNVDISYIALLIDYPYGSGNINHFYCAIYQADENAINYFAGNIGIGTLPSTRLDISDGAFTMKAMTAPDTPSSDNVVQYVTASGTSPNREVALKAKFEDGQEVIIASRLV